MKPQAIEEYSDDLITLDVYCALTMKTAKSVYMKIYRKAWTEGKEFFRDPQKSIWISRSGVQEWVRQGVTPQALKQEQAQFKSSSGSRVKLSTAMKLSHGALPRLT